MLPSNKPSHRNISYLKYILLPNVITSNYFFQSKKMFHCFKKLAGKPMKTAVYMIFGKREKEKVSSKVRGETFSLQEEI